MNGAPEYLDIRVVSIENVSSDGTAVVTVKLLSESDDEVDNSEKAPIEKCNDWNQYLFN